ncbi:MAG: histidine--tRNA ligase [Candidatus Thermoplasmatota archaeon]|nr:histidine--tRNA ligase [Candidatus Thermoplasmatota archaeon]
MFQLPRGTRDFTPRDMQKRRYAEDAMRTVFQSFGYQEIQTPTFETLELFTAKSGEGIIDELYSFTDKGGRELALRPELTAPVMRFYVEKLQMEAKPLKLFYFGNCFRYDRPQKGRYREFWQAGCELVGTDTPESYAELISLAYAVLRKTGLKDITINIGNLTILSSIFTKLNLSKDQQQDLIPLIDKAQFDDVEKMLQQFGVPQEDTKKFLDILQTTDIKKLSSFVQHDAQAQQEIDLLTTTINLLPLFNVKNYCLKMSIVRGLDYYKGIVFEIDAPNLGAEKQLCGGGAYELIPLFGGRETPTAGFAIGFDRTLLALETEKYAFPSSTLTTYVIPVNEAAIEQSFTIVQQLRSKNIATDIDLLRRGIRKALKYASSINAKTAIIVGPQELKQDAVMLRDMKSGKQELVKLSTLPKKFQ